MLHTQYRPDIDGLRAVAVISVVLFHAFPNSFKGGFVGVDVFFVISGFLISLIIFNNLHANAFSFIEFYGRRVRRIFPSLILVLAVSLLVGWFILLQEEYKQLAKHVISGAGFVSNIILWSESGYFDNEAQFKPLLHLWSLGVEEQFYIFWPLVAWGAWLRRLPIIWVAMVIIIISFSYNIYSVEKGPVAAFYLPFSRIWELMCGSLLAWLAVHKQDWLAKLKAYANGVSIFGILLILSGIYYLSSSKPFPGWLALIPVIGAVLLIIAGPNAVINRNILSSRIAVWFGLISYPLYLWHWPIISFIRIVEGGVAKSSFMFVAMVVSILLAWTTYQFFEKPVRARKISCIGVNGLCFSMLMLAGIGFVVFKCNICSKTRLSGLVDPELVKALNDFEFPEGFTRSSYMGTAVYKNKSGEPDVLFFGDSHIEHLSPLISHRGVAENIKTISFMTSGGCPPIPNVYEDLHPDCFNFIDSFEHYLEDHKNITTIVVGACWNCYFIKQVASEPVEGDNYNFYVKHGDKKEFFRNGSGKKLAMEELENFIHKLSKHYKVYFILDNPMDNRMSPVSMLGGISGRKGLIFGTWSSHLTLDGSGFQVEQNQLVLNQELKSLIGDDGTQFVELIDLVCPDNHCRPLTEVNKPIYRDAHHMRPFFVRDNIVELNSVIYR